MEIHALKLSVTEADLNQLAREQLPADASVRNLRVRLETGLITSGAGRDLDQVEAIGFPCFTNGTICSHGDCHIVQIGVPVHVGGMAVHTGDLLHGDRNGVTSIPHDIASAVGQACAEYMAAEAVVLDYVRGGKVDATGFAAAHKECRARIEALAKKVRGRR